MVDETENGRAEPAGGSGVGSNGIAFAPATPRLRAADQVFDALAAAILRGQFPPETPLPAERALTAQFGVSRVLVRQAVHRLEEIGLVRVRQGGQTIVLDPMAASDPRVLALRIELSVASSGLVRDLYERQLTQAVVLLELAEGRLDEAQLDALDRIVERAEAEGDAGAAAFIMRFWTLVAAATQNDILVSEVRYWFDIMERRFGSPPVGVWPHDERMRIHREVARRLRARENAAEHYLRLVRPLLAR